MTEKTNYSHLSWRELVEKARGKLSAIIETNGHKGGIHNY